MVLISGALRIVDEDNLLTMQINILPYTDDLVTSGGIETIIFVDESAEKLRIAYDWPKIAKLFENSRQDLSSLSSIVLDLRVEDTRNEQKVVEAFPDLVRKMLRLETLGEFLTVYANRFDNQVSCSVVRGGSSGVQGSTLSPNLLYHFGLDKYYICAVRTDQHGVMS